MAKARMTDAKERPSSFERRIRNASLLLPREKMKLAARRCQKGAGKLWRSEEGLGCVAASRATSRTAVNARSELHRPGIRAMKKSQANGKSGQCRMIASA